MAKKGTPNEKRGPKAPSDKRLKRGIDSEPYKKHKKPQQGKKKKKHK